jgi:ribosomal protein L7/L12
MLTTLLYGAIATTVLGLIGRYAEKHFGNITIEDVIIAMQSTLSIVNNRYTIRKTTGRRKLVLVNHGENRATVLATIRQITGIDYNTAQNIVNRTPSVIMTNISDAEADLTKQALEFVGAKCEIK